MSLSVREGEDIRAFGFSPDGATFVVGSSPRLVIFNRGHCRHRLVSLPGILIASTNSGM
jgi:hypothetical protein